MAMDHDDATRMLGAVTNAFDRYRDDAHFDGDRGASEWTLAGTIRTP